MATGQTEENQQSQPYLQSDPAILLKQIFDKIEAESKKTEALAQDLLTLRKTVFEDLPKSIDAELTKLAESVAKGLKTRDEILNKLATPNTTALAVPSPTAENPQDQPIQLTGIGGTIQKLIDGIITRVTAAPAQGGLTEMDMEILKNTKAIQLLSLKNTFKMVAKQAGIPETALETVEHIAVT